MKAACGVLEERRIGVMQTLVLNKGNDNHVFFDFVNKQQFMHQCDFVLEIFGVFTGQLENFTEA